MRNAATDGVDDRSVSRKPFPKIANVSSYTGFLTADGDHIILATNHLIFTGQGSRWHCPSNVHRITVGTTSGTADFQDVIPHLAGNDGGISALHHRAVLNKASRAVRLNKQ